MGAFTSNGKSIACGIDLTKSAREGIEKLFKNEADFFRLQHTFCVHIEKLPENRLGNLAFALYFDKQENEALTDKLDGRLAVMHCIYKDELFLATGFQVRGRRESAKTNRRHSARINFLVGVKTARIPLALYNDLQALPVAMERSSYVEKRIKGWEGYLSIEKKNADVPDITTRFSNATYNEGFTKLTVTCQAISQKDIQLIRGFSVSIGESKQDVGEVVRVKSGNKTVEIALNKASEIGARSGGLAILEASEITFSNFAEISQIKRLRQGFKALQDGHAANPNLEKILFEERPVVRMSKGKDIEAFHSELNEFQRAAVTGAMNAHDLYVIQGPPGTGKTTVISEICYQNVKAGLRTLVASQANLAVDNALGRLFTHQDIRILRYGRTESIEEEGQKFIEENVALHWKEQTLASMQEQMLSYAERERVLRARVVACETEIDCLQRDMKVLEEAVQQKRLAQKQHDALLRTQTKILQQLDDKTVQKAAIEKKRITLREQLDRLPNEIARCEAEIAGIEEVPETVAKKQRLEAYMKDLQLYVEYEAEERTLVELGERLASVKEDEIRIESEIGEKAHFITEVMKVSKFVALEELIVRYDVLVPTWLSGELVQIESLHAITRAQLSEVDYTAWNMAYQRVSNGIAYTEQLLLEAGYPASRLPADVQAPKRTVGKVNELADRVGNLLQDPATQALLETQTPSDQRQKRLDDIALGLRVLMECKQLAYNVGTQYTERSKYVQEAIDLFTDFKRQLISYVEEMKRALQVEQMDLQHEKRTVEQEYTLLNAANLKKRDRIARYDEISDLADVAATLAEQAQLYEAVAGSETELQQKTNVLVAYRKNLAELTVADKEQTAEIQRLEEELLGLAADKTATIEQVDVLKSELSHNPEDILREKTVTYEAQSKELVRLKVKQQQLPVTHALQMEWMEQLEHADTYDLDEIRKLYVKHANIIGTTCVRSARKDFMDDYPEFDVVIIDEVSKATPPELLLPMLKGKKIILVGDHHQLPPLIGHDTFEELLKETTKASEAAELEVLLKESLFERLYRTLPSKNKMMLGIQYRMHEQIMDTIVPFYEDGGDLQCGLIDSDGERDHFMEGEWMKRSDHLLWYDMPNREGFFESRMKGGTSLYNEAELAMTRKLLLDLEAATIKAKAAGLMKPDDKKSVGVISFYGEQVKRIDRLLAQELQLEHVHCRTGSVDKFQGMEMDVIILSFVRNHNQGGSIGFARDYRRLNVALSRARELLIVVGSADMFTKQAADKEVRDMYTRLVEDVRLHDGFKQQYIEVKS